MVIHHLLHPLFIKRTDSTDKDFGYLAGLLNEELRMRDGPIADLYEAMNKTAFLPYAVVGYEKDKAIACGAFRYFDNGCWELKRMFVKGENRGQGIATLILKELEDWCQHLGGKRIILETGKNQPEANSFYQKHGYRNIPAFGRYEGAANSICFEKMIR